MNDSERPNRIASFEALLAERILVLDGAMGTMIQAYGLDEADFRATEFADHPVPLKGCNDLLSLTQPDIIEEIHRSYLNAGADIIETNTFNATSISIGDYRLEDRVYEINKKAAEIARRAADGVQRETSTPRFVAGSMGPTNRTASMSPDVNDPAFRAVSFDDLSDAYYEQARGLVDGGVDILLPETSIDTLNIKAALWAIMRLFHERSLAIPVIASVSIVDESGRTLSQRRPPQRVRRLRRNPRANGRDPWRVCAGRLVEPGWGLLRIHARPHPGDRRRGRETLA